MEGSSAASLPTENPNPNPETPPVTGNNSNPKPNPNTETPPVVGDNSNPKPDSNFENLSITDNNRKPNPIYPDPVVDPKSLHNVFSYGTLQADEVIFANLNRVPSSSPAILDGYHRFAVKQRLYPGILPAENDKVIGKVYMGITDHELSILDEYEDAEYTRRTIEIALPDNPEKLIAYTYVWADENGVNLYGNWDFEEWKKKHIEEYLSMTATFFDERERPESKTRMEVWNTLYYSQGQG